MRAWLASATTAANRDQNRSRSSWPRSGRISIGLAVTEVVGGRERRADGDFLRDLSRERAECLERMDEHVLVSLDPLEPALRQDQRLAADDRPVAVVDGRRDDQVHRAELVFDEHEDDAVGGCRTLPRYRHSRNGDPGTIGRGLELS